MERQVKHAITTGINSWHPGGLIVNLILLSVAGSFVIGHLILLGAIVYISIH